MKQVTQNYLAKDLLSLHELLSKVNKSLHRDFNIEITGNLTI